MQIAILVRGDQFSLRDPETPDDKPRFLTFQRDQPQPVSPAVARVLKDVYDPVTVEGKIENRYKFEITSSAKVAAKIAEDDFEESNDEREEGGDDDAGHLPPNIAAKAGVRPVGRPAASRPAPKKPE